ncbi:TPA: hypothetical protein DCZ46_01890 [Candidatus Campbellbacteria bacterium]|nr:MAG: small-conductance mechanosensitive ion channel [Candidatus Campbellbacteria bacterium GW2011_OD1_34_28]KKP75168.1 MAG: Small-conductance mechanosensitive ion channel-like protein [Candidatus Campbellbacteria bacterium GW2011_GWD2_35_24]KKP76271.1 MAG: small-conductance mechanosensitive ion channel [Candidatus Campbellbacteria bacterium GW2011_GWC2_35_28]KKP77460.1 MAG: Small-conductance mechanosensitive ion channel-like protein [Candidatus Campbellbacteria bacterium GW2011_GWC1_35_31]KK
MILKNWSDVLAQSFQDLWLGVISFVPNLVIAVIIFIAGWVVGSLLGRVVSQIIKSLKVDNALRSAGTESLLNRAGFRLNSGKFLGGLVKWFVIVAFLVASFDVLGLDQVNDFLQQVVLLYLPRVIVAVLILLVAALIAEAMESLVKGSAKAAEVKSANFLGNVTKWAIWVFAILMALYQLGVAAAFVQTLFTGFVVALALASGLAFGLGGKDSATKVLKKLEGEN